MNYAPEVAHVATPIGTIELRGDALSLTNVSILTDYTGPIAVPRASASPVGRAVIQISEYFARQRQTFDLALQAPPTPRGAALRAGIASIAYGETLSYGELAHQIKSGPRAVGQACRRNPFPIIIPCHRVTTANGPEHYSGGAGIDTKAWLNAFERGEIST